MSRSEKENENIEVLESIIDEIGLSETIRLLMTVCSGRASDFYEDENQEEGDDWGNAADQLQNIDVGDL